MRAFLTFVLFAVLAFAHDHAGHSHSHGDEEAQDHVLDLNNGNFADTVAANELTMVEFYAPWCGHCKRLAPEYEKAASELWGKVALAKVDCTLEKELCAQYEVQGFPTLKVFKKDGSVSDYDKGRTAVDIVKFLSKQSQPAFTTVNTEEELTQFKTLDSVTVVIFSDDAASEAAVALKGAAEKLRNDAAFAIAKASLGEANKIVLFRNFDEPQVVYAGELDTDAIIDWVTTESVPLVGEIGPENYSKYVDRGVPLFWMFLDYAADSLDAVLKDAAEVASTVKGKLAFVKLDGARWASHAKNFGLKSSTPGLVIEVREGNKKYIFPDQELSKDNLAAFANSFVDGTLAPTVRSAEIPESNDGPVTVLVGKTYDAIVNDPTKDVLVEFYAPWCGHCKTLAPQYEALGEQFVGTNVIIAKIDATENDHPRDDVKGFPTIIFFPANNKAGLTYNGERSTAALAAYVKEKAAAPAVEAQVPKDEL